MVEETTVCLQCGNRGYENAFVYCIRCLKFAVHRYCLDVLPDSFDEFVCWLCDDCNLKERKQSGVLDHDAIPSQRSHHEVSKNIKGFSENGNKKNGLVVAETNKHACENGTEQTYDARAKSDLVECGESASQHTPVPVEFPVGCLTQKKMKFKIKTRGINIRESTTEKDQDRLATVSYDECLKVDNNKGTRLASNSSLPSKVKENEFFQQKDQTCLSKPFDSITDLGIAGVRADHSVISSNGPSRCSKKDGNAILLPEDVSKRSQHQEENDEGNPIEQKRRKFMIRIKRRERNFSESTTEKDQGRFSTACNDECSKVDIIECTRSASDSTLPSKVKENEFSEQNDQLCVSKPSDAITDLDIAGVPADHPVISSNGPSVALKYDGNGILLPADVSNRSQLEEEKVEGNLIEPIELSAGCLMQKKMKKIVSNLSESTTEKDQGILSTACNDECLKEDIIECTRSASGSTLPSKVKENEFSDQNDQLCVSKLSDAVTDLDITCVPADHPLIACNGPSEGSQNDGNGVLLPADVSNRSQLEEEKVEGNLIEPIELSAGCLKQKKNKKTVRNFSESTYEKDQGILSTACNDECSKVDINECTRSASNSTLPSKVKEPELKDQLCVSKPFVAITDPDIAVVPADHPVISSNGPSVDLTNDGNLILLPAAGVSKQSQLEEEKIEGNLIKPIEVSAGCLKRKKKKKRKRNIVKSTTEKHQHEFATTSYDECVEVDITECTKSASDSTLPSNVNKNKRSEQKDQTCVSKPFDSTTDLGIAVLPADVRKQSQLEEEKIEGNLIEPIEISTVCLKRKKKKKRRKNIMESTSEIDHGLATASYDERLKVDIKECTRSARESTFPSKAKENKFSEQKDQTCISKPFDSTTDLGIAVVPLGNPVFSCNGSSMSLKIDGNGILLPADVNKRPQLEGEKIEGNLMEPIELSTGCLKRKKKKRKRNIVESTTEKDQHGLATTSYGERVDVDINECTRSASDSTFLSKVKENESSEQKDQTRASKPFDSTTDLDIAVLSTDHPVISSNGSSICLKNDGSGILLPADVSKRSQFEEEKVEGNLIELIELSAGFLNRKKKKKSKRTTMESTTEKDQHGLATTSYDERVKVDITECKRSASDSTLPSKVKENKCSEQKDRMHVSKPFDSTKKSQLEEKKIEGNLIELIDLAAGCLKRKKKKRKRNIMESTTEKDQHGVAMSSYDERVKVDNNECTRSASDSTLPSKVKENKCSEKKNHMCVSKPLDSTKRSQLEEEKIEGNLIEAIDLSAGCLKRKKKKKRKRNIMESTTEKDQHGFATASYGEPVKVEINECTRSASDSTLPSKVKESECSEQNDHKFVFKPFDSTTDLGIAGVPADHPVTSSNRSSRRLQKKKTITSLETVPLEQLHQTGVAQPLQKNRTLYLENEFSDLITEERVLGSSKDPIENREPEVKEEKTFTTCQSRDACKYYPKNLGFSVAQPVAVPVWRGSFSIWNEKYDNIDLLMAHISNKACHKVYEATSQFQPALRLEMRPKSDLWPTSFQTAEPNGDNIALYFFPSKMSEQVYEQLVGVMIHKELAFRAFLQNAELLIFTSTELPLLYWTFRSKYYLWGVFRGKQPPPSSNALSSEGEFA